MRQTDFGVNTATDGRMAFRTLLPLADRRALGLQAGRGRPDGLRPEAVPRVAALRRRRVPARRSGRSAKRALEYAWAASWDADRDGVMEGEQHNTYDIEFYGPNTMCGSLYLGALRAGARMAEAPRR